MSKHNENRRKDHANQLAKQIMKKNDSGGEKGKLAEQYRIIKDDLMKLRDDLTRGYDVAKEAVDKKTIVSEIMKLRGNL
jgi:ABC-type phosphate transport system auxiliary subunit